MIMVILVAKCLSTVIPLVVLYCIKGSLHL